MNQEVLLAFVIFTCSGLFILWISLQECTTKFLYTNTRESGRSGLQDSSCDYVWVVEPTFTHWIPHVVLWLISSFYIPYLYKRRKTTMNHKFSSIYHKRSTLMGLITTLVILENLAGSRIILGTLHLAAVNILSSVLLYWITLYEEKKGLHPSPVPFVGVCLFLASEYNFTRVMLLYEDPQEMVIYPLSVLRVIRLSLLMTTMVWTLLYDILCPTTYFLNPSRPGELNECGNMIDPFNRTSLFSRCSMAYMLRPMLRILSQRLSVNDLFEFDPHHGCKASISELDHIKTNKGTNKLNSEQLGSFQLVDNCWRLVMVPVIFGAIARLFAVYLRLYNFVNLGSLIAVLGSTSSSTSVGVMLCFRACMTRVLSSIFRSTHLYITHYTAARVRGIAAGLVMKKYLRLSSESRRRAGGEVISLISVDVQKVGEIFSECNIGYELILYVPMSTWIMWRHLGPVSLLGICIITIIIYVNSFILKKKITNLKSMEVLEKSSRLKLLRIVIQGIQALKLMAWEGSFEDRLKSIREKELHYLQRGQLLQLISSVFFLLAPAIATASMLIFYVMTSGNVSVTAEKMFVTISLLDGFAYFTQFGPVAIIYFAQGKVSLQRLLKFMDEDEETSNTSLSNGDARRTDTQHDQKRTDGMSVEVKNASYAWKSSEPILHSLNFRINDGELVMVVGLVGSGKSSLLSALLGEMCKEHGQAFISGSVGYAPQEPWILHTTIKENIIFGQNYDAEKFTAVIEACDLGHDIEMFPNGMLTEIGERGVTLSGGQKHRVSLARVLYSDANIHLLDDTLSAVDTNVAATIFNKGIGPESLAKHKTRILVTHSLQWLPFADKILVINEGTIVESGTLTELMQKGSFLKKHENDLTKTCLNDVQQASSSILAKRTEFHQGPSKLMTDETMEYQKTLSSSIWSWLSYIGGPNCLLIFLVLGLALLVHTCYILWLGLWGDEWKTDPIAAQRNNYYRLTVFVTLAGAGVITTGSILGLGVLGALSLSKSIHTILLHRLIRASMTFFHRTPSGRILNWFSSDLDSVDISIPKQVSYLMRFLPDVATTLLLMLWSLPGTFLLVAAYIFITYHFQVLYSRYTREVASIEGITKTPVLSFVNETVQGVVSIKSYKREKEFCDKFYSLVDRSNRPLWHIAAAVNFQRVWPECLGSLIVLVITILCVLYRQDIHPAASAGVFYGCFKLTEKGVYFGMAVTGMGRALMSLDRLTYHNHIDNEGDWSTASVGLEKDWPSAGQVKFTNVSARYHEGLPLALHNINFTIKPGEKIGVVGRTGAGKTSLTLVLMRILELSSGSITIDNINIRHIGLHDLRSKVTVITQEPLLCGRTIRQNLDPFQHYTDYNVWQALDYVYLKKYVQERLDGLNHYCGEMGENVSTGQRQQLCLARALLRRTRILVLDEPTAAVDIETDRLIQKSLREHFKQCTLITVAHRINTIIDYDRVMVIHDSQLVEFDTPTKLRASESSLFSILSKDTVKQ